MGGFGINVSGVVGAIGVWLTRLARVCDPSCVVQQGEQIGGLHAGDGE